MYKLLLCLRYLRTRYLAIICVVSVMLGVAILIVVNSVMSGFSNKLKDRLHNVTSDVTVNTDLFAGFPEPFPELDRRIRTSAVGPHVEATAPTVEVYATLQFSVRDRHGRDTPVIKPVKLIGVDADRQARVGGFDKYLFADNRGTRMPASFDLSADARERFERKRQAEILMAEPPPLLPAAPDPAGTVLRPPPAEPNLAPPALFPEPGLAAAKLPPPVGVILGYSLAHFRYTSADGATKEIEVLRPGDDVFMVTYGANKMMPVSATFAVAGYFKSEMSQYDESFVFVPIDVLQRLRGMDDTCNTVQIKLTDPAAGDPRFVHHEFVPKLQAEFPPEEARVQSWQQQQSVLLSAIDVERGLLNLLLFMIVGVAGFSILAIFTMIVSEKYRDIGILKSLGASGRGVMVIFLGYGLLLGTVGCVLGTALGVGITRNINMIEKFLSEFTGTALFPRDVYYFDAIPTHIDAASVGIVNFGAAATAVLFSVLPAVRAARLQPVRALRFE